MSDATRTTPLSVARILSEAADALDPIFRSLGEIYPTAPARLIEAVQYSLLAGGKRLRPALVLETFRTIDTQNDRAAYESAVASAAAMEMIHTFSLVHDDLPAMDNDDLRRGRPTNHKVFGEALAILAGDALVMIAFELIANRARKDHVALLVAELARASGATGMIGGQVLDMAAENQGLKLEELQRLHALKTGALLTTSCRMGAIAAGASSSQLRAISEFGDHLGIAFQIIDDLLDVTATAEQMGKATAKDAARGKNTYPALLGVDATRQEAQRHLQVALAALDTFANRADGLRALGRFVVERNA